MNLVGKGDAGKAFGGFEKAREQQKIFENLRWSKKIAGFEDREDKEYYTSENVLHDLKAFTEAKGLEHPTQLTTSNIESLSITTVE